MAGTSLKPAFQKGTATPYGNVNREALRSLAQTVQGYEQALGPRGGLGDWRPEIRQYLRQVSSQWESNFRDGTSNGTPMKPVSRATIRRRVVQFKSTVPLTDFGQPTPPGMVSAAYSARFAKHKAGTVQRHTGWRGLRGAFTNTQEYKFPSVSLYKIGRVTGSIGVNAGPDGIAYAKRHLKRGPNYRDYTALGWDSNSAAFKELVLDGIRERINGWATYKGSYGAPLKRYG
jgi:hypothetical protein